MKLLQKLKTELIKNKSIFIFDFDGVIVDSMTLKGVCFCNIFKDIKHDCNNQIIDFHLINGSLKREKKIDYIVKKILKFKLGHNTEKYLTEGRSPKLNIFQYCDLQAKWRLQYRQYIYL